MVVVEVAGVDVVGDLVGAVCVVEGGVIVVDGVVVVWIGATVSDVVTSAVSLLPQAMATTTKAVESVKRERFALMEESGRNQGVNRDLGTAGMDQDDTRSGLLPLRTLRVNPA